MAGALARLSGNLSHAVRRSVLYAALDRRAPCWLVLRLAPPLDEIRAPSRPWSGERPVSLIEALRCLESAAGDPRLHGVCLRLAGAPHGLAAAASLRRAVDAVRAAGKDVVAYGDRLSAAAYWVATGASQIWLPETGSLDLVGLRSEGVFLGGLLSRLDVRPEVIRMGTHKTAAETFTREQMSPEQREQIEAYLDDLYQALVEAVASGRGLSESSVRDRIDAGPYGVAAACEAGLIDGARFPDEVEVALAERATETRNESDPDGRARWIDARTYYALHVGDAGWRPLGPDLPHVAYLSLGGTIRRGGWPFGSGVDGLRALIERLRRDPAVRAIVLRVHSPGGDALASDLLWRALHLAARDKPLVVSMGEVAASGGYLAAVAGHTLLAEAPTLTGSIGVVGGKLDLSGLYERLGIGRDGAERGRRAGILSDARGFTPDERSALRKEMRAIYEVFLRRVGTGRSLPREAVERVAEGRVWSGARARGLQLVDALGGPLEALREARARAGIAESERFLVDIHPRLLPFEGLRAWFGSRASL